MAKKKMNTKQGVEARLDNSLLLGNYMLSKLGVQSWEELVGNMKAPNLEGWDEENVSYFCRVLCNQLKDWAGVVKVEDVLRYDRHIYDYTLQINELRQDKIVWKYFQWVELLFVEIYLDKYFSDKDELCSDLNRYRRDVFLKKADCYIEPFFKEITIDRLNKLAVWCATGSGKTLMMHANMLQLRHYANQYGMDYNNTLLITPKENLSNQHRGELEQSGIQVQVFSKKGGSLYKDQYVQVTEITKLAEEDGELKVNVDFFENRSYWEEIADKIVFTGKIDEFYNYQFGKLNYRTVRFETEVIDKPNYQGNAVVNYTERDIPFTRVIEHKHFEKFGQEVYDTPKTVISKEYSTEWKDGMEPYYPVNDKQNSELYAKYKALADKEDNIIFGGRLAEYKYYDMAPIIEKVLDLNNLD